MGPKVSFINSQINTVYASSSNLLKNHINIILPSMPRSWKCSVYLGFPHQTPFLSHIRATLPALHILFDLITWVISGEEYRSLRASLCSLHHSPVTTYRLGPNIFVSTLFLSTLRLCSPLNLTDLLSHPYKTTRKIIVHSLYFWMAKRKKKCYSYYMPHSVIHNKKYTNLNLLIPLYDFHG
jgi:hypothetical protein